MQYIFGVSLLILAVIAVRAIFRKTASPKMIYALWLVVLIRLLLPFQLFEVEKPNFIKIPDSLDVVLNEDLQSDGPTDTEDIPAINNGISVPIVPGVSTDNSFENVQSNIEKLPNDTVTGGEFSGESSSNTVNSSPVTPPKSNPKNAVSARTVIRSIWIGGSIIVGIWFVALAVSFSLNVKSDRKKVGSYKKIPVYVSKKVGTPCLYGIKPSIYLTPKAFKNAGREMILCHEYTHLHHGDNLWSFFRIAAITVLWWNPLVWLAAYLSKQDGELACDYSVTGKMNESDRIEYARIIIAMLPVKRSIATAFAGSSVKERVIMMTKKNRNRILSAVLSIVIVLAVASCSFVTIKEGDDTIDNDIIDKETLENEQHPSFEDNVIDNSALKILLNAYDFDIRYISLPNTARGLYYDYDGPAFASDKRLFRVDRTKEYGTFDLYLVDIKAGAVIDTLTVYSDIMPTNAMIQNGDYILYRMYYDTDLEKSVVETAFKVTYENGELICNKFEIEMYPFYQEYIENSDKTIRVYRANDDEGGHGGIDIVYSDGRVERVCENVMLDDDIGGKKAGIGDVTGYTPTAFIDENRFAYHIGGWEWTQGYGIYDISTGEKTEYLDGLGLQAFDDEGNLYVSKVTSYEVTHYYKITKVTPDGEKILIASKEDELVDENVIKLESHGNKSIGYQDNYGKIYEFFEDRKPILTITSPDFKKELFKCEYDNSKGEVLYFIKDGTITFICFGNEPIYPYTESSELTEIFKEFLAGGKDGAEGEVLKNRMVELTGWSDDETDEETPQVYFTKWQDKAIELYTTEAHEKLKTDEPEYFLLGSLTHKYFEYYNFSHFIPNENAKVEMVYEPYENVYYYLCSDKNDPKKTYVYFTNDFGRTVGTHKIVPPNDIEFDSMTPVFMACDESYLSSDSCIIVYKLTNGSEEIYVTYDSQKANFPFAFIYNGRTDEEFLNSNLPERRWLFETRVDIGDGHELQIELNYGKKEITKSYRAEYSYENDNVNELYMWRIAGVFGNNSTKVLIASDRYPAWVIVDVEEKTAVNAFPNLDKEIIKLIQKVETHDGNDFILFLSDGRIFYHKSFKNMAYDIAEAYGIENVAYAEIAHKSTIAYIIADGNYADVYTYHVINGERNQIAENIPWNENDPKALKLHNSKGYGTYFYQDDLFVLDFRLGKAHKTDIEYAKGIEVTGLNENSINIRWENLPTLTRGIAVR